MQITSKELIESARMGVLKLSPRVQWRNPVMFVVFLGALITTIYGSYKYFSNTLVVGEPWWFTLVISVTLWITVLFANMAEAIAESKGKSEAATLRALKRDIRAKKLDREYLRDQYQVVSGAELRKNDVVQVEAGDIIPADGEVLEGIASVDESAITGESAPVIRESGTDHNQVTGGTRLLSDWLIIRINCNPGEAYLDNMASLVESTERQRTPVEISLTCILAAFTLTYLISVATLLPFSLYSVQYGSGQAPVPITMLIALLVCLVPTTIGGLLSPIGIAGINRLLKANVIALSGRAVEAAGDVNVVLLDKTGTITHGNRRAEEFILASGVKIEQLTEAVLLASIADYTPEGKSILALAYDHYKQKPQKLPEGAELIEFTAETRVSGIRTTERTILKGALDAVAKQLKMQIPEEVIKQAENVGREGGTPLVVADNGHVLGLVHLKDIVKVGIKDRLSELRRMGIRSVMITGDNPVTAAAIAAEAGADDFLAEATPEDKLLYIRDRQMRGDIIAMVGDGTNDAPALAQANVALAMNTGTQPAKEAANMIDLDSDPTKLIEIVEIGKQLLITRGSLMTFSLANDVAKYAAIVPAAFGTVYPELRVLDVMQLNSPLSATISAIFYNALSIIVLMPLALRGVKYQPTSAAALLRYNLFYYGLGGIFVPFIGIKGIDMLLGLVGLV